MMGFQWDDPFGIAKRRARRRAELEQHLRFVRTNNFDVIRLDRVYQKARTGEKGYGLHMHSGQPCDIWFPGAWPDAKKVYIVQGFWRGPGTEPVWWHHHSVSFFHVNRIIGEIPWKVWRAGER